jgi:hypothetical protein
MGERGGFSLGTLDSPRRYVARGRRRIRLEKDQILDSRDRILRLNRFADQLICFHRHRFLSDFAVHHSGRQNHGRSLELRMILDGPAIFAAVHVGQEHVAGECVRNRLQRAVNARADSVSSEMTNSRG